MGKQSKAEVANNPAPVKSATAPDADGWDEVDTGLPEFWSGDAVGDSITGRLASKTTARSKNGDFVIHTIETDAGPLGVSGAKLTRALENVTRGAMVRITYLGKRDISGGRTMRDYKVQTRAAG